MINRDEAYSYGKKLREVHFILRSWKTFKLAAFWIADSEKQTNEVFSDKWESRAVKNKNLVPNAKRLVP